MKLSAQEEYGLRCLFALAQQGEGISMTIPEIARLEGLTQPHAAKLLSILRKSGFISSTRGHMGGYTLAKRPQNIRVGEVLDALGGRMFEAGFCSRHSGIHNECLHEQDCMMRGMWNKVQTAIDAVVFQITLADLLEGKYADENVSFQPVDSYRKLRNEEIGRGVTG